MSDFFDYTQGKNGGTRFKDSENKIFRQMDNDIYSFLKEKNLRLEDIKIETRLETTYEPCVMCKREILVRQELYNGKFEILHPKGVEKSQDFIEFLK